MNNVNAIAYIHYVNAVIVNISIKRIKKIGAPTNAGRTLLQYITIVTGVNRFQSRTAIRI